MKFRTVKSGYDPEEVDAYIKKMKEAYDESLIVQRDRIFSLKDELSQAEKTVEEYNGKREQISRAIESALSKADEIERLTKLKAAKELGVLRRFHKSWMEHYAKIIKKYPLNGELKSIAEMDKSIQELLDTVEKTPSTDMRAVGFDPVGMIENHLAAESVETTEDEEEPFDYDAAMHPEEDLGKILSDLGILFEEK